MAIIDGKLVAKTICDQLQQELITLNEKNINCHLVIIQVGDVYASNIYVKNKQLVSERVGLKTTIKKFPETITQEELIGYIVELNEDHSVNGILVQLPLPKHINESLIIATINPNKDVDCFHLNNVGKL
jgi:methylenetetrahydrofolate dehydrogenase (NADP+)/methenyltetrahydrofolate cyclohydrolase